MRFIVFMLPNITDADWMPSPDAVAAMTKYNEELHKAGLMLDGNGLHPQNEGVRVEFGTGGKKAVTDGPFTETKEMIGGYWIWQAKSKAEAVEWASRCPAENCTVEIRQIMEIEDFPPEVQAAAHSDILERG